MSLRNPTDPRTLHRHPSSQRHFNAIAIVTGGLLLTAAPVTADSETPASGELTRGMRWVRSHPFTLMALTINPKTFHVQQYRDQAGLNTLLAWKPFEDLFKKAVAAELPWHMHVYPHPNGLDDQRKALIRRLYDSYPGSTGCMVWDEPNRQGMIAGAKTLEWLRKHYPDMLVYSNALPGGGPSHKYVGNAPPPGGAYSYEQYLRDFVTIMKSDIVMYDAYPFKEDGDTINLLPILATAREVALEHGVPYWTFVQSSSDPNRRYRMPSESDIRMQVFMHLTYGFTGIAYFTYGDEQGPAMVSLPPPGTLNPILYDVGRLNGEVKNIGRSLRWLTSTDVRLVPGPESSGHAGVGTWEPGAGGDTSIRAITIHDDAPDHWKDILVGLFRDDDGHRYVMVTNLWHDKDRSSSDRQLSITLTFDPSITQISRLSRETGRSELLVTDRGDLHLTLAGGTGELLRPGGGSFPDVPR